MTTIEWKTGVSVAATSPSDAAFGYRLHKDGTVRIAWHGKDGMTLAGRTPPAS